MSQSFGVCLQAVFNCEAIEAKDLLPPFMAQILDNIRVVCFVDKIEYSRLLFGFDFDILRSVF